MPVGEGFDYRIDSTRRKPTFYSYDDPQVIRGGAFTVMSAPAEQRNFHIDPRIVQDDNEHLYLARIQGDSAGAMKTQFEQAATIFHQAKSVALSMHVYDRTLDVPVTGIRLSEEGEALDVLVHLPQDFQQSLVGELV